ncbi:MAG TPA: non-canonical purine NTP pyrophosphatase [Candidatus Saccharimonadales bacterium]
MDLVFITGNQHKADALATWLGRPIKHHKLDLDELQSLDLRTVVAHKARQAYGIVGQPVLVEDVALTFTGMGRLPGTFVKWFLEEIGNEGLCRLADGLPHRKAVASVCYAMCDGGEEVYFFDGHVQGLVPAAPRGDKGWGWDPSFQPDGSDKTYGEMTETEVRPFNARARAVEKLKRYLERV